MTQSGETVRPKSTIGERVVAWLLAAVVSGCGIAYLLNGGRGWAVGMSTGLLLLIAEVAGIAER